MYLGLDIGTSGVKAVLVDDVGHVGVDPDHDFLQLDGALVGASLLGQGPGRDDDEAVGGDALQHHALDLCRHRVCSDTARDGHINITRT